MHHEFCDTCEGCRPAIMNTKTGKVLPAHDPVMIKISHVWDHETTYAERKAFIEVTLHNSRDPETLRLFHLVAAKIQASMEPKQ